MDAINNSFLEEEESFAQRLRESLPPDSANNLETFERKLLRDKREEAINNFLAALTSDNGSIGNVEPYQKTFIKGIAEQILDRNIGNYYFGFSLQGNTPSSALYHFDVHDHLVEAAKELDTVLSPQQRSSYNIHALLGNG